MTFPAQQSLSAPAAPLPADELARLLTDYRTCEFATMATSGVPIAWPCVCIVDTDPFRIRLTTSIGARRKALNVRRDPRVALLFSDPTGSNRTNPPQVLIQGTAICPEEISTSPAGMERYWSQLAERQPDSRSYGSSAMGRALFDFYYMRLVITVTPEAVTLAPPLVRTGAPAREPKYTGKGEETAVAGLARRLSAYPDAVLATAAPGALPDLRRVQVERRGERFLLRPLEGDTRALPTGPANLLFHSHDEAISALQQFGALGTVQDGGEPVFTPRRILTAMDSTTPRAMLSTVRRMRRDTRRYLEERALLRPRIAWDEHRRISAAAARTTS